MPITLNGTTGITTPADTVTGNATVGGTLTVTGTTTIGGITAVAVAPGANGNVLTSNGTAWTSAAPSTGVATAVGQVPFSTDGSTFTATQKIVQGTAVASTSGTSIDFTSIPSWVKRITVMFNGVSTSGTNIPQIQIGAGSIANTGYTCGGWTANINNATSTTGFLLGGANSSTWEKSGIATIVSIGSNIWVFSYTGGLINYAGSGETGGGNKTLSGTLDRVRITTVGGTDTFDAGSINIMYE